MSIVLSDGNKEKQSNLHTGTNSMEDVHEKHGPKSESYNEININPNDNIFKRPTNHTFDPNSVEHFISLEALRKLKNNEKKEGYRFINFPPNFGPIKLYLWTPEMGVDNAMSFQSRVTINDFKNHKFDRKRPTKIICHGWLTNANKFVKPFADAYFSTNENVNIIGTDFSLMPFWYINYFLCAENLQKLGVFIGQILRRILMTEFGQRGEQIHIIGHSLGGHLAGFISRIMSGAGDQIYRVTALDPAGPWFDLQRGPNRLEKSDAKFVDVIHSNQGNILNGNLGLGGELGSVDFYPNGGTHQSGCSDQNCKGDLCLFHSIIDILKSACSHLMVVKFYTESIKRKESKFFSVKCDSWEQFKSNSCGQKIILPMGEQLNKRLRSTNSIPLGKYFLQTNQQPPYSL